MTDRLPDNVRLAVWLGRAIGEHGLLLSELQFLTELLGIELPAAVVQGAPVTSAAQQAQLAAQGVQNAAADLEQAAASGGGAGMVAAFILLGRALHDFYQAVDVLMSAVSGAVTVANVPDATARATAEEFAAGLAKKISDYALASAITERNPELAFALKLAGLLDWQFEHPVPDHDLGRAHVRKGLRLHRIKDLIREPANHFRDTIGWGDPDFDPIGFFRVVLDFFEEEDDIEAGLQAGEPFLRGCVLIRRDSSVSPPGLALTLIGDFDADREETADLNDAWELVTSSNLRMAGGVSGRLTPPLTLRLRPLAGQVTGELRQFVRRKPDRPIDLFGGTGLLALSADGATAGMAARAQWDATDGSATIHPLLFATLRDGTIRISASEADSFVGSLLSRPEIDGKFDLGLEWEVASGLRMTGSGGIEIALPAHRQLGRVELKVVYLALRVGNDGTLSLEASTALTGTLGPLTATVDRLGALLDVRFAEGADAEYGAFDLDLRFKAPTGIGLSIDGGGFKGGGFLSFDRENERYAGVLELAYQGRIELKAIGLLTTRLPGGAPGYSLLVIITSEFTPIQLGLGFTLNGVGGLLGLNRTAKAERLRTGLRDNTLNSILFPQNIVANADRIISDLRQVFPPQDGRFLFGPMARIGWGSPNLITVDLGLLIEVPEPVRVLILGVAKALLPDEKAKLLQLQVNFLGEIDFERELFAFDASLFDSKLLTYPLSGDMAVRLKWGDSDPNFLLTVGGFHPAYDPPPLGLPSLRKLTVKLLSGNNPRLTLETYFAVTSNTAQFGARVELYAAAGKFNVYGFLAFDTLFQFNPFYFIADVAAMLALRVGNSSIASIQLALTLEGTTPWKAKGTATLKLCWFIKIKVRFDKTFGQVRDTRLDDVAVLPLLRAALADKVNWSAAIPSARHLLVSTKEIDVGGDLVAHPIGVLEIVQRVVPLDVEIQKFGHQRSTDGNRFAIEQVRVGAPGDAEAIGTSPIRELFAPAQFFERTDAEKLSGKSFERYDAGVRAVDAERVSGTYAARREVDYELFYIDSQREQRLRRWGRVPLDAVAFDAWASRGAVAASPLSFANNAKPAQAPGAVRVSQESFAVVNVGDLKLVDDGAVAASEAGAFDLMRSLLRANPALEGALQVVPSFEVNGL